MITDIRDITSFKWATVKGIVPLAIQLDGDTAPLALIPDSLVDPLELAIADRVRVELSLRKVVIHGKANGSTLQGTASQRDARFGVPTTDAQRVALANKKLRWFNTDLGWEESFYAVTGLSGLTARGLEAGTASGWYPTGRGPAINCTPDSTVSVTAAQRVSGWQGPASWSNGGTAFIEYTGNGTIQVKIAGRYRVRWNTTIQTGGGQLDMWLYAGTTFANDGWELNATVYKKAGYEFANVGLAANDTCYAYVNNFGPVSIHIGSSSRRGEFTVEYLGPRLVTN